METLFLHAKSKLKITLPEDCIRQLPKGKIGIITTIQYMPQIRNFCEQVPNSIKCGQVLGCRTEAADRVRGEVSAYLYIGSGRFHPVAVAFNTKKEVYCYNPITSETTRIGEEDVNAWHKEKRIQYAKFLHADDVGILITTKAGQAFPKEAEMFLSKNQFPDKKFFRFAFDTLNVEQLDNFNFIDVWVNTACPRITDEKNNIVNLSDIRLFMEGAEHKLLDFSSRSLYSEPAPRRQ